MTSQIAIPAHAGAVVRNRRIFRKHPYLKHSAKMVLMLFAIYFPQWLFPQAPGWVKFTLAMAAYLIALAAILILPWNKGRRLERELEALFETRIYRLQPGRVRVRGRISARETVTAPLLECNCVYYRCRVLIEVVHGTEFPPDVSLYEAFEISDAAQCLLQDGTGELEVDFRSRMHLIGRRPLRCVSFTMGKRPMLPSSNQHIEGDPLNLGIDEAAQVTVEMIFPGDEVSLAGAFRHVDGRPSISGERGLLLVRVEDLVDFRKTPKTDLL